MEWQTLCKDHWVYGVKVRGIVRTRLAEVYYDEDREGPEGGWIWFCFPVKAEGGQDVVRGVSVSLNSAIYNCEQALGVKDEA